MLEKAKSEVHKHAFLIELEESYGKDYTKENIMEFLYGTYDYRKSGSYTLYTYKCKAKRSPLNRINMLWVYPIFMLIAPFQWMFTGDTGVKRESKAGKVLERLIGYY